MGIVPDHIKKPKAIPKEQKKAMQDTVTARLEDSGKFTILESELDHVLIRGKPGHDGKEKAPVYVCLHTTPQHKLKDYGRLVDENTVKGVYTADVFFGDESHYRVRPSITIDNPSDITRHGKTLYRTNETTLRGYTQEEVDRMIRLRGLEKSALERQTDQKLVFYNPHTQHLELTSLGRVVFDYRYIPPERREDHWEAQKESIDFKLQSIDAIITSDDAAILRNVSDKRRKAIIIPGKRVTPRRFVFDSSGEWPACYRRE